MTAKQNAYVGADAHIGPNAKRKTFPQQSRFVAFGHRDDVGIVPYEVFHT